VLSIV
jgi:hypothetical protein